MSSHVYHVRGLDGRPYLVDECPGCERHTEHLGLSLDATNWRHMWQLMIRVEITDNDVYKSTYEKKLCVQLYEMYVALERYTLVIPRHLEFI